MDKKFTLILLVVVAALIGLFILTEDRKPETNLPSKTLEVSENDHTKGNPDAKVVLIEYADFACPGCGALFPLLKQAEQEFGSQVLFVFRHFPLTSIHPNSMAAHRASEAAHNQGQFWEMHDLLFARQTQWTAASSGLNPEQATSVFEGYAQELGLNLEQYSQDFASPEVFTRISTDIKSGNELGVTSTPTLFLNGEKISLPSSWDDLKQTLQTAIDQANQSAN